ncbi:MAG: protein kinase [Acidobacteriota bacterium]|nr:MAG: protein kinase [Acidobacteriota bacterium]
MGQEESDPRPAKLDHPQHGPLDALSGAEAARAPLPEIPGHRLLYLLGEGGMAKVYLARDVVLNRPEAIKVLSADLAWDEEARARFLQEARVMATLDHPNVVRIYSVGKSEGRLYLAMEYIAGESLARRIWESKGLEIEDALEIARQCVQAVHAAWRHGIVHRDLKPSNILLDRHGRARVADFGLAKSTKWLEEITLPDACALLCTPHYVSPEQARGDDQLDFRSDIYSLGIVLFEMLTGERPHRGKNPMAVLLKNVNDPLPDLRARRPEVPENVAALVEWMTRKDPGRRPGSYEQLGQRLDELLRQLRGEIVGEREEGRDDFRSPLVAEEPTAAAPESIFVGREPELAQLERFLHSALEGGGRVAMVTGEAGTGKTALLDEFASRAGGAVAELIVASGTCVGVGETGDPYGPFRQILGLLTGDLSSARESGRRTRHDLDRLKRAFPRAARTLTESCPDLLAALVDADELVRRARHSAPRGTAWVERLQTTTERLASRPEILAQQPAIIDQYGRLLAALAADQPLLLSIDDLHRADPSTLALLHALGRRLDGHRVLLTGAYRGSEADRARVGESLSLAGIVDELESVHGKLRVPLDGAGDRSFVDALIDREPNALGEAFRAALYERTGGHPLFTIELLRALQDRGDLERDAQGRWIVAETLGWDLLPERVEAVIRGRLRKLSPRLRRLLQIASVEGESFTGEVLAHATGTDPRDLVPVLGEELVSK